MTIRVNYGAGWSYGKSWLSYDASPTLRFERFPLIGRFLHINSRRFPVQVQFGDIVKGLPLPAGSADCVFASHVLEHLPYSDALLALKNTYKMMAPGGTFRLIVPDLAARVRHYASALEQNDPHASGRLMRETSMGIENGNRGIIEALRRSFGHSHHLWMWDEPSMSMALANEGFVNIRRCAFGDARDPAYSEVEDRERFFDSGIGVEELALEAFKPLP